MVDYSDDRERANRHAELWFWGIIILGAAPAITASIIYIMHVPEYYISSVEDVIWLLVIIVFQMITVGPFVFYAYVSENHIRDHWDNLISENIAIACGALVLSILMGYNWYIYFFADWSALGLAGIGVIFCFGITVIYSPLLASFALYFADQSHRLSFGLVAVAILLFCMWVYFVVIGNGSVKLAFVAIGVAPVEIGRGNFRV